MIRVADFITKFIYDYGVKDVFLLSGGGIIHLTDGLFCLKKLKKYCLHHEQAVSMALEAYAKTTDHFGVGYFTTGPGATNALTGLAGAWLDSVPCLFISGQVRSTEAVYKEQIKGLRQVGVQEINILPIVESITKYAAFVDSPSSIRYHLEKAVYLAKKDRPGPVWLDIPINVQDVLVDPKKLRRFKPPQKTQTIAKSALEKAAGYFKSASRPVILAGRGVRIAKATGELSEFARNFQTPIVTTFLGVDLFDSQHPQYVGRIGIKGDRAGNLTVQNADLLIVLGSSLPVAEIGYDSTKFAREAKVVVVDVDLSSHRRKTIRTDLLIKGDAKEFLQKMSQKLESQKISFNKKWLKACVGWREKYPVFLPEYKKLKNKINIYYFIEMLSRKLTAKDAVVTDAGSAFYAGSQGIKIKKGMRYITSGGFATMGYSLPASIGVSAALGRRRVMCITGDGSFQQNIQELQTAIHYKLPLKIFVLNNEGYLSIRKTQTGFFKGHFIGEGKKSGVSFPDTEKIARAYGIKFIRVSKTKKLNKVLDEVLSYKGLILCEIMTPPDPAKQMIIPTVTVTKKADGTISFKPLEDMFPFLDREKFKKIMFVKPLEE